MSIEAGDKAPNFTLPTDGGGKVSLAKLKGKKVILYFYPKADRNTNAEIIRGGFISIGADMLGNLFQEFLAKKLTLKRH